MRCCANLLYLFCVRDIAFQNTVILYERNNVHIAPITAEPPFSCWYRLSRV